MSASITSGSYPRAAHPHPHPVQRALRSAWLTLRGLGQQRARQQLFQLAHQRQALDPTLARQLRDAARHCGEF